MTREELLELITELQEHQSELSYIEAKTAKSEMPKRLYESLSAFVN